MLFQYRPLLLAAMLAFAIAASADPAPFDLTGPTLDVTVTRGGKNLADIPGSKTWSPAIVCGSRPICPRRSPRIT